MTTNYKRWRALFLFCLGLFAGTAFCMKWMEGDFLVYDKKFTIIGLEIIYTRREVINVMTGMDEHVRAILRYHCYFDFFFMAGVYPGIAAICMMAKDKVLNSRLKKILTCLAVLQGLAWAADITENYYLLKWIDDPDIGAEFLFFNMVSLVKWIIALAAVLIAVPFAVRKKRPL